MEVTADVIEAATQLRAAHNFRAPDAIHLASALAARADVFLTGRPEPDPVSGTNVEVLAGPRETS